MGPMASYLEGSEYHIANFLKATSYVFKKEINSQEMVAQAFDQRTLKAETGWSLRLTLT